MKISYSYNFISLIFFVLPVQSLFQKVYRSNDCTGDVIIMTSSFWNAKECTKGSISKCNSDKPYRSMTTECDDPQDPKQFNFANIKSPFVMADSFDTQKNPGCKGKADKGSSSYIADGSCIDIGDGFAKFDCSSGTPETTFCNDDKCSKGCKKYIRNKVCDNGVTYKCVNLFATKILSGGHTTKSASGSTEKNRGVDAKSDGNNGEQLNARISKLTSILPAILIWFLL